MGPARNWETWFIAWLLGDFGVFLSLREKEENDPGLFSFLRGLRGILGRWYLEPTSLSLDRRCELRTDLEGPLWESFFPATETSAAV